MAYELEGSKVLTGKMPKWLEDNEALCCVLGSIPIKDDARIRDFTGEMIIRDGEIVLTESDVGREPYTITLKEVTDDD